MVITIKQTVLVLDAVELDVEATYFTQLTFVIVTNGEDVIAVVRICSSKACKPEEQNVFDGC